MVKVNFPKQVLHPFKDVMGPRNCSLEVTVSKEHAELELCFELRGSQHSLLIPDQVHQPERKDQLWEHTCFEAFFAPQNRSCYWEFNVSPSGDWNVYAFDGYRAGMRLEPHARINKFERLDSLNGDLKIVVKLDFSNVPGLGGYLVPSSLIFLGLTAVLEDSSGQKSYWALKHPNEKIPGGRPDFHQRESFVFQI